MGLKAISRLIAGAPDYESGSWTPTLGVVSGTDGSHAYGQQEGAYVRVGSLVWIAATMTISPLDSAMSGAVTIKGLPFVNGQAGFAPEFVISILSGVTINTAGGFSLVTGSLRAGASDIALREVGSTVVRANLTQADFASACGVSVTGTYQTTPSGS